MKNLTYGDQLAHLGILSLELHRLHLDLIYCYKIVFGLTCLGIKTFFTLLLREGMPINYINHNARVLYVETFLSKE